MKKIWHIAENVSNESGGLRTVVVNLNEYLNHLSKYVSEVITNKKEISDDYIEFPTTKIKSWNFSKELKDYLFQENGDVNILHLHGVFMHTQYIGYKLSKKNNIPFVITPHGMLEPWHLKDKQLKKEIYLKFILNNILKQSKVLHAITPLEKENLYRLTGHKNIIEIPNFIHFSKIPNFQKEPNNEDYLLFLSRLHPKKGLDILIKAMNKIEDKKIRLKIVGAENAFSEEIKKECFRLNISHRVDFVGSVFGEDKYKLYANAKAFVLPSYSEAIGMVNLEAAVCNTPVITTFNTGINPDWNNYGGIMINPDETELVNAINQVTSWSDLERKERGLNLSYFVYENYSWEKKGHLWDDLYGNL